MNLDDASRFSELDPQGMLAAIDGLPAQLEHAWHLGQELDLPRLEGIRQVIVAGMGGSAIGADLLAAYLAPSASVPIHVWRNYDLPAYAGGPETLVIASSHSGNTEETLSAFERALEQGAQVMAVTTGGKLSERAKMEGRILWPFEHAGQPRSAVGYSFGLLLATLVRLGLAPDAEQEIANTVGAMEAQQQGLRAEVPVVKNPAKRMAGQLMDRWPVILGAGLLAPVARRWRTQIAEIAKAVAQFEELPEADHNMVAGVDEPEALFGKAMILFLGSSFGHARNQLRADLTREIMMVEGFNTDIIHAAGETRLAQQWSSLHYGDYVSYYLAMAYEINPTPVRAIEGLKARMKEA